MFLIFPTGFGKGGPKCANVLNFPQFLMISIFFNFFFWRAVHSPARPSPQAPRSVPEAFGISGRRDNAIFVYDVWLFTHVVIFDVGNDILLGCNSVSLLTRACPPDSVWLPREFPRSTRLFVRRARNPTFRPHCGRGVELD